MPIDSDTIETQRALLALLRTLETGHGRPIESRENQRSEPRQILQAPCVLSLFVDNGRASRTIPGIVRNIAFSGVSVVAKTGSPVRADRPVEIEIDAAPGQRTYAAGTVAFCRRVTEQCFEIGIAVQAVGASPILVADIALARSLYEWFDRALQVRE